MEFVKSRKNISRSFMGLIVIMLLVCVGIIMGIIDIPTSFGHGKFWSGNVSGIYALISIFFSAGFIWYTKSQFVKGAFGVGGVVSVIAMFFSYSEGMWLWMALGVLGYLLILDKSRQLMTFAYLSLWFFLGSVSGFWIFNHFLDKSILYLSVVIVATPILGGVLTAFLSSFETRFQNFSKKESIVVIFFISLIIAIGIVYCISSVDEFMYTINIVKDSESYVVNLRQTPNLQYSIEAGLFGMLFWIVVQRFRFSDKWNENKSKWANLRLDIFLGLILIIAYLFFSFDISVLVLISIAILMGVWIIKDKA